MCRHHYLRFFTKWINILINTKRMPVDFSHISVLQSPPLSLETHHEDPLKLAVDSGEPPLSRPQRSWNILISALARHGFFRQATEAFQEMLDIGLRPDHITFVSLLSACSHGGLVDEGLAYFSSMTTEFGVPTRIEHCVCIIDLLGRSGKLAEAKTFIDKMPVPPNDLVWRSLLAACKIHGNLELGRKAVDHLLELDSSDDSAYVLYSNVCASTQRWGDVVIVRKQIKSHSLKNNPAEIRNGGTPADNQCQIKLLAKTTSLKPSPNAKDFSFSSQALQG